MNDIFVNGQVVSPVWQVDAVHPVGECLYRWAMNEWCVQRRDDRRVALGLARMNVGDREYYVARIPGLSVYWEVGKPSVATWGSASASNEDLTSEPPLEDLVGICPRTTKISVRGRYANIVVNVLNIDEEPVGGRIQKFLWVGELHTVGCGLFVGTGEDPLGTSVLVGLVVDTYLCVHKRYVAFDPAYTNHSPYSLLYVGQAFDFGGRRGLGVAGNWHISPSERSPFELLTPSNQFGFRQSFEMRRPPQ